MCVCVCVHACVCACVCVCTCACVCASRVCTPVCVCACLYLAIREMLKYGYRMDIGKGCACAVEMMLSALCTFLLGLAKHQCFPFYLHSRPGSTSQ